MINKLVADIKKYAWYLEENNIYVSIHTEFTEYMMPLLDLNIHKNPKCLLVKSDNDSWERCIRLHSGENHEETQMRLRTCFAGVEEAIFGLECGGTVCISTAEKIDEERLGALVNPLCRMVEYLKMICPKDDFEITDNELVNRAIKFIQRNFYNHISNEEIAGVCSCSVSTLCHLFKKFKGISVRKYICDLRISYAKELLKESNLSITLISYKTGFSDYNYFAGKFKKETGFSPSEYRRLAR